MKIFISYKSENRAFAQEIREKLHSWGYETWLDAHDIQSIDKREDEINAALAACDLLLGVLTPIAIKSEWVTNEWEVVILYQKPLILLEYEKTQPRYKYARLQREAIDFTDDKERAFTKLKERVTIPSQISQDDPYAEYLKSLYKRINKYLKAKIIPILRSKDGLPDPINLHFESVSEVTGRLEEIDPLFQIGGVEQEEGSNEFGDFQSAFDYYEGRLLLLGEAGAGKTITLLEFGRDMIIRRLQGDTSLPLPILGIIPTWSMEHYEPILDWLSQAYGSPTNCREIIQQGQALLLLDGLDELGHEREDPNTKDTYDPQVRFIEQLPLNNQILLTSRSNDYGLTLQESKLRGAIKIKPLDKNQLEDYLSQLPELLEAIEADKELASLLSNPLLISIFSFIYLDKTTTNLEKQAIRDLREVLDEGYDLLFKKYVEKRYGWESNKRKVPFTLDEVYSYLGETILNYLSGSTRQPEDILIHFGAFMTSFDNSEKKAIEFIEFIHSLDLIYPPIETEYGWRYPFTHLLLRNHFAYPYAVHKLTDTDIQHRRNAANVLWKLGDRRAKAVLIQSLKDDYSGVRINAARALGVLGDVDVILPILEAIETEDEEFDMASMAEPLAQNGFVVIDYLISVAEDKSSPYRECAAYTLGFAKDETVASTLAALLNDADFGVQYWATYSLGRLGNRQFNSKISSTLKYYLSPSTLQMFSRFPKRKGYQLRQLLRALVFTVGELEIRDAAKPLVMLLQHDDYVLREEAHKVLDKLDYPHSKPDLPDRTRGRRM